MDWDQGVVTSSSVPLNDSNGRANDNLSSRLGIQNRFREFVRHYRDGPIFVYRDQLVSNYRKGFNYLLVNLEHVHAYEAELQHLLIQDPSNHLPLFESAAKEALAALLVVENEGEKKSTVLSNVPEIQIVLKSSQTHVPLRNLAANEINKLVKIPGIIISATKVKAKCTNMTVKCRHCGHTERLPCISSLGGVRIPQVCGRLVQSELNEVACPKDSYLIVPDASKYVDQQTFKLQESPEVVPTGEMPRNVLLSTERYLVDRASPGTRVSVIGISSVVGSIGQAKKQMGAVALRLPYIQVVGIEVDEEGTGRARDTFTPAEEETFHEMARDPDIYDKISKSIAPSIYGEYTTNIKKAIACQLIGGSRKQLPDGMMLRGDINVLLLGDPSTAKSQFLKFAGKVAPVGVYTSGKGSSAAGLTASVLKDGKGEFRLEGGAMVLADGGVVCIDEFDKMRESDRVAIHEAMEQQTISIAKAGITTILNSRASVLAAANPVFGRYDDMRSASDNIDMMSTILSRFDMIFIVRDIQDEGRDRAIASHIVRVHANGLESRDAPEENKGEFDPKILKKYITYCRTRCAPRLGVTAAAALSDFYVNLRDDVRKVSTEKGGSESVIPVTVRQLEALVRISESLAKMNLRVEATEEDVMEAIRLFRVSTMNASKDGGTGGLFNGFHESAVEVEQNIKQVLRIRDRVQTSALYAKLEAGGANPNAIQKAIRGMVQKGLLRTMQQFKFIERLK